jgi:hypothetical protein
MYGGAGSGGSGKAEEGKGGETGWDGRDIVGSAGIILSACSIMKSLSQLEKVL